MLIAFQCLWDNLSNNCFSCFNSVLRAANKSERGLCFSQPSQRCVVYCIRSHSKSRRVTNRGAVYFSMLCKTHNPHVDTHPALCCRCQKFALGAEWLADLSLMYCTFFPPSGDPSAEVVTNLVFVKKWHSQIFSLSSLRHPIHPPLWWPMTYFFSWWREWKLSGPWNPKPPGTVLLWSPWKVWLVALVSFFFVFVLFFFLTMLLLLILYLLCVHLSESYDEYIYKNIN